MFYELRRYAIRPGCMDAWVEFFEEEIVPFQVARGAVIAGLFRGETDEGVWVWQSRIESEAERERLYEAVYQSEEWKTHFAPRIGELMDREKMVVERLVPTPHSVLR